MKKLLTVLFLLFAFSAANSQWQKLTSFPSVNPREVIDHFGFLYGTTANGGMYVSYDGGITFTQRNSGLNNAQALQIHKLKFMTAGLYAATTDGVYLTTNDGVNWVKKSTGITIGPNAVYAFAASLFEDNGAIYAGTYNSIYRSTNAGDTWTPMFPITQHLDIASFYKFNNKLFAGTSANNRPPLLSTTNDGTNWSTVSLNGGFPLSAFCMLSDVDTLFVGTSDGMWVTTNNGANWSQRNTGMSPDPYMFSLTKSGSTMIAGMNSQILKSTNNGITWTNITNNLNLFSDVQQVLVANNKVYITGSDGLYWRYLSEIITEVPSSSATVPEGFKLNQNYPNPFNPVTNITFEIFKPGLVTLTVYDLNGKEVKTLVNEHITEGYYTQSFNASLLGSGIYYYKLEANGFSETKKMLLIK